MLRPISMLVTGALALLFAVGEPASMANAGATPGCDTQSPQPTELLTLLPQARRELFAGIELSVALAELDGAAPREAIAFADYAPHPFDKADAEAEDETETETEDEAEVEDESDVPRPDRQSVLWIFGCKTRGWELLAEKSYRLDEAQYGDSETEGAVGFKVVKAERLLPDRDVLRVEWVDLRDGHSPFYTYRTFDLYTLRNDQLSRVLICSTLNEYRSGPERSGRQTTRTIQFLKDKLPARIRIAMRSDWDPGVEPDEPDKHPNWEQPRDGNPDSESRTAIYRYDGTRFVTERPACDERLEGSDGR